MTVHSLVLFENGFYTEISKEFDLSVHNSIISPETHDLVQDNYMTFFYPQNDDKEVVFDYAKEHRMNLIEGWEVSADEQKHWTDLTPEESILFNIAKPFPEGFKMFRIHYWTEEPIHWELNPDADLFVFNSDEIQAMVMFN
jgi:hypothetical protein